MARTSKNTSSKTSPKTTRKTAKVAKTPKGYSKKGGPRGSIMGLPIESNLIDHTVGEEGGTPTKQTNKIKTPKAPAIYTGAPIQATRVFYRVMPQFKFQAECWLILNEEAETFTTANTYGPSRQLKSSYNPSTYTYPLNEKSQKKIDKKLQDQGYLQVEEVADFPTFCTFATRTMDLLPKSLQKKVAKLRKSTKAK